MLGSKTTAATEPIRALFVSDLHLGSRFSRDQEMLQLLQQYQPEMLYLVGDIVDARVLQRRWYWPPSYNALVNRLVELAAAGTQIFYSPGYHDSFLRDVHLAPGPLEIQDSFTHLCLDGRRLSVLHGDQFDGVESHAKWLSRLGSVAYEMLLGSDRYFNQQLRRLGLPECRFSRFLKQSVKRMVQHVNQFETQLIAHIDDQQCDGLVCGHIHLPAQRLIGNGFLYVNLGDWIENTTGLIEWYDGRLELIDFSVRTRGSKHITRNTTAPLSPQAARLTRDFLAGWTDAAA